MTRVLAFVPVTPSLNEYLPVYFGGFFAPGLVIFTLFKVECRQDVSWAQEQCVCNLPSQLREQHNILCISVYFTRIWLEMIML